jgi:hypothetical protein
MWRAGVPLAALGSMEGVNMQVRGATRQIDPSASAVLC